MKVKTYFLPQLLMLFYFVMNTFDVNIGLATTFQFEIRHVEYALLKTDFKALGYERLHASIDDEEISAIMPTLVFAVPRPPVGGTPHRSIVCGGCPAGAI